MSRDPFDPSHPVATNDRPRYEHAENKSAIDDLAERIVNTFQSHRSRSFDLERHLSEVLYDCLEKETRGYENELLADILRRLEGGVREKSYSFPEWLIQPMVQVFFDFGRNDFVVDYQAFDISPFSNQIGSYLEGSKERPLRVAYWGGKVEKEDYDMWIAGQDSRYCHLVFHGRAYILGTSADQCTMVTDAPPRYIGSVADHSDFFIGGVEEISSIDFFGSRMEIQFRTPQGIAQSEITTAFNERGNHLYIPDGESGWREVECLSRSEPTKL